MRRFVAATSVLALVFCATATTRLDSSRPIAVRPGAFIDPGGALRRECPGCQRASAEGMLLVKEAEGEACFSWVRVTYPEAGCFQVVQAGATAYQVRDPSGRIFLEYLIGR